MKTWTTKTIGELCDSGGGKIQTGPFGSQLHESDYSEHGIPVVMPKDIFASRIEETSIARVSDAHVDRLHRHKLSKGDIVYGRRGDIGRQALIRDENVGWLCGTGCLRITLGKRASVDYLFLHRYLQLPDVISWIQGQAIGATMPNLNTNILRRMPVTFPNCLTTQRKIAGILSAYDELISNNNRLITLLEKLAEEIYREWFVRFRCPGHEKAKLVKGVPEGWRVAQLQALATVNPSSVGSRDRLGVIRYVDISSVSTNRIDEVTDYAFADAPGRARRRVKHGDVIWSSVRPANRAYCLIYEPSENLIVSTGFAVIRPNAAMPFTFLFFAVTSNPFVDQMTTVAKGAAYPATSFDDFEKANILVPTDNLLQEFHTKAEPLFHQKHLLQQQSDRLIRTRDLLLPRLISGKLSVEDLDIRFSPSMVKEQIEG